MEIHTCSLYITLPFVMIDRWGELNKIIVQKMENIYMSSNKLIRIFLNICVDERLLNSSLEW